MPRVRAFPHKLALLVEGMKSVKSFVLRTGKEVMTPKEYLCGEINEQGSPKTG